MSYNELVDFVRNAQAARVRIYDELNWAEMDDLDSLLERIGLHENDEEYLCSYDHFYAPSAEGMGISGCVIMVSHRDPRNIVGRYLIHVK